MKLWHTHTSPYVRKVMVVAHECGLASRIETTFLRPNPTAPDATLSQDNPLSKIPTLLTDDGLTLYDSGVICDYLDSLHDGPKLIPQAGAARWNTLRVQALCNGILEAAILVFYEKTMRPEALHWAPWMEGQTKKATQGLDALEREVASFGSDVDLGQICTGATLGWLEFRSVVGDVRKGRPALSAWYARFNERASMKATAPHD
jgi:glutathione S-transferase